MLLRDLDAVWILTAVVGVLAAVIVVESVRLRELRRNLVAYKAY